ncbi:MAG: metal-sensitive transcriptional regulator [Chloroflexi bacterium]|nr:metal-sensitive transcriptional regulator [Chloroflexota bacterium]
MLKEHNKEEQLRRLKIIAGHIRGIQKMVENDAYCIEVIAQVQAVQSALEKFSAGVLEAHLNSCVTTALQGDDIADRKRVLSELITVFAHSTARKAR